MDDLFDSFSDSERHLSERCRARALSRTRRWRALSRTRRNMFVSKCIDEALGWDRTFSEYFQEALAWDCTDNRSVTAVEGQSSEPQDEDLWGILPDELLERILAFLPVTNIFRAGAVCKRWNPIIASKRFLHLCEEVASTRPWYFMCKDTRNAAGLAYDPIANKWHNFELPLIDTSKRFVASVNGLVCFMDSSNGYDLYICNPMTKATRKLPEPSKKSSSHYYTVSMTVNKATKVQTTVVARSDPMPGDSSRWSLSIEVYDSSSKKWRTTAKIRFLSGGRRDVDNGVICNGFFYCVIHSTVTVGGGIHIRRLGLVTYQLSSGVLKVPFMGMPCSYRLSSSGVLKLASMPCSYQLSSSGDLMVASMGTPCSLTCVRLMNCNNKLVMVGGIGNSGIFKGIGIWELDTEWREVAKMPNNYFRGFDISFCSSGSGDLIYIHAFGSPQLVLYDMSQRSWRWAKKCPMVKEYRLHRFTGFCFEPRLEACP